ncbi:hypothetical protein IQ16_01927 [Bradyrhizobium huanghuaihaiense]|uniref:Secreted protein n=1 Tax=Bradyrhizobium huanghuaihaiense TaxID=990078 RepID=A0A562RXX7_9BRAD|nr:hypothetical protein [Bradyrhizobium huanghuaihaiense]TWI73783.1 hypothetical protein IQ16_01927 [Bradyrhizobium huanghuaihaiense]
MTQAETTDTTSRRRFLAGAAVAAALVTTNTTTAAAAETDDTALVDAAAGVLEADRTMNALLDAHGDDADSRPDYMATEAQRYGYLETLATVPAIGTAGLLAKARTLQVVSVTAEPHRHQDIALSLADDLTGDLS